MRFTFLTLIFISQVFGESEAIHPGVLELAVDKILDAFNKELETNIKVQDLSKKEIVANLEKEIASGDDLLVSGTPTIYVNGEIDPTKELYKSLIKK